MARTLLVAFVFFAIFVAGIITGGFVTLRVVKHRQAQKNNPQQAAVAPLGPFVVRQILGQLDLTPDQHKATNKILMESGETMRVLRRESDFAVERLQEDVAKILSPDQRVTFDKLMDEKRTRWLEQREKARRYLEQIHDGEAAPVSSPPAASAGNAPPPATQSQPAVAPMQPAPAQ